MGLRQLFRRGPRVAVIHVELNARVQPMHRGEFFEDPLDARLQRLAIAARVAGGGTRFDADFRIVGCDIDVHTIDPVPGRVADLVAEALDEMGVPRGSFVAFEGVQRDVGSLAGIRVVLPAVSTVDRTDEREIERNHELDALVDSLRRAATESPTIMSFRIHRGSDSEVYLYGPDGAALRQAIEATVAGRPIGVGAVIDSIA